jgi:hypothetical protein
VTFFFKKWPDQHRFWWPNRSVMGGRIKTSQVAEWLRFLQKTFWSEFEPLFLSKQYKSQSLPAIKIKESFLKKIMEIRHSRNDIFHNNPPKIKRGKLIEHIELILLHLGYNLFDAVNNIDPEHKIIQLKYIY